MEVFGECPQALTSVAPADLPRAVGDRARWLHRFWQHARKDLDERGLMHIYEEIERPLVPVLAEMERVGIRVDPARLEAFAKELERNLDNLTREIYNLAGEEFTIASPKQLAQILFEKLKLPALRRTKTGYSTDADVLSELAQGKSNAAIAAALSVSERAVEKHTNSIFAKLGLSEEKDLNRRVKAVLLFLAEGEGG